jgi:hypothetical protein
MRLSNHGDAHLNHTLIIRLFVFMSNGCTAALILLLRVLRTSRWGAGPPSTGSPKTGRRNVFGTGRYDRFLIHKAFATVNLRRAIQRQDFWNLFLEAQKRDGSIFFLHGNFLHRTLTARTDFSSQDFLHRKSIGPNRSALANQV